jgi:hypothetical protein
MDWDEYRREFAGYHAALAQARYEAHAGLPLTQTFCAVEERYADLFRREAVDGLDDGAFFTETEKESVRRLRDALRLGFVNAQAREVAAELSRYKAAAQSDGFVAALLQLDKSAQRREFIKRRAEHTQAGDDLRAELRQRQSRAAQDLGFTNLAALCETVAGVELSRLAKEAAGFLAQTEKFYRTSLAQAAPRCWPGAGVEQLNYADWLFRLHQPQPHLFFAAHDLLPTYGDALRGLGWRAGGQNITIDEAERPGKDERAACFAVRPPDEVCVALTPPRGVSDYRDFFAVAGRAQHHAWTSRDLANRHPAFVFAPDAAVNEGYAALFRAFFYDAAWLREYRAGLGPETAAGLVRDEAWLVLAEARRDCALLLWEIEGEASGAWRDEALAEKYADAMTEATGFRHDAAFALAEICAPFAPVARLRGLLLAAVLGDYLRVRHGRRWWASRRAGDELTDWWNAGSRYPAEELAQLTGAGELSFDLLAETLQSK